MLLKLSKSELLSSKFKLKNKLTQLDISLGVMIEIPSAVIMIDTILQEVDFICIGSNDLIQFTLAADRTNPHMEDTFHSIYPSVIRTMNIIAKAANKHNVLCIVCGEITHNIFFLQILIGLGITNISLGLNMVAKVAYQIERMSLSICQQFTEKALACITHDELERVLANYNSLTT